VLTLEIGRTLDELKLGLSGALNVTDAMEVLSDSMAINAVPAQWEKRAYPSTKTLGAWYVLGWRHAAVAAVGVPHVLALFFCLAVRLTAVRLI
jgi:hypothetical protein